ncbi:uncharacterized protein LOC123193586 isoform X2 [Mangifera indica]|uniref:uncharacterized protein LOC123193586 isoform X2 n=1 Tax=Mangifera indica TaxID=29780 RepID=UPI001CFB813B|nr:uncharacterized protein LOC123193586 isoform X2 [Mangifera indica]
MAPKRLKKKKNFTESTSSTANLISGLKLPILKRLYYLLINSSSFEAELNNNDICSLADVLFNEVDGRFKEFLCGQALASLQELALLLRCCMVFLNLLVSSQSLLIEKGRLLLSILRTLISVELNEKTGKNSITHVDSTCVLLQVFADELLMHKSLREYFMLIDSLSSTSETLFMCHFGHGDIGTVMEVIAAHFILLTSGDKSFECFVNGLFWQPGKDFRTPEMSLMVSLSLLLNPIMHSAPKMFQAYLILLLSEAVGVSIRSEYLSLDLGIMDCYLTALERSIILYKSHFSNLHMDDPSVGSNSSSVKSCIFGSSQLAFESYLQPATKDKIDRVVTKLNESLHCYATDKACRRKSDLVDASIAYIKQSLHVFDGSYKDKIMSILISIVQRCNFDNMHDTLWCIEVKSPQDICLLASLLKLMSSSMLQAIWCLRHSSNSGCLKTLQDVLLCKEYEFIRHLVGCFRQFNNCLPIQKFVFDVMKTHSMRHKESKWMFLHFSGLLSLSYVVGLDFLVKDCLFIMMSLLDLFVFEEGDLDALSPLFASGLETISSRSSDKAGEALLEQKSSKTIASKFQKMQTTFLSKRSHTNINQRNRDKSREITENAFLRNVIESNLAIEEETVEACNGEAFLKCLLEDSQRLSDLDDLVDFIECKRGKDYNVWLKDRQRFRKWKSERNAVYKRQKWIKIRKCRRK